MSLIIIRHRKAYPPIGRDGIWGHTSDKGRVHEGLLAALVAFEDLGRKVAGAILRQLQFQGLASGFTRLQCRTAAMKNSSPSPAKPAISAPVGPATPGSPWGRG